MAKRRKDIKQLVERSSLGAAEARWARSQVSERTARAVLARASRSVTTGRFVSGRGTRRR